MYGVVDRCLDRQLVDELRCWIIGLALMICRVSPCFISAYCNTMFMRLEKSTTW